MIETIGSDLLAGYRDEGLPDHALGVRSQDAEAVSCLAMQSLTD